MSKFYKKIGTIFVIGGLLFASTQGASFANNEKLATSLTKSFSGSGGASSASFSSGGSPVDFTTSKSAGTFKAYLILQGSGSEPALTLATHSKNATTKGLRGHSSRKHYIKYSGTSGAKTTAKVSLSVVR